MRSNLQCLEYTAAHSAILIFRECLLVVAGPRHGRFENIQHHYHPHHRKQTTHIYGILICVCYVLTGSTDIEVVLEQFANWSSPMLPPPPHSSHSTHSAPLHLRCCECVVCMRLCVCAERKCIARQFSGSKLRPGARDHVTLHDARHMTPVHLHASHHTYMYVRKSPTPSGPASHALRILIAGLGMHTFSIMSNLVLHFIRLLFLDSTARSRSLTPRMFE